MKKTKLLTSLAALALVVGLGACNEPEEDISSETTQTTETDTDSETTTGETSSENTSESESTSQSTSNPGSTSEPNYTYAVVVNNAEQLSSILEYDADDDSHQIFSLDVTLYTYEESGEVYESKAATASDVVVSDYDDDLFGFDGLTGYVNGAGTSSVTITWTGYASTTIELTVTDITRSHDDDEIAMEIINSIKENGVEWDAVHAETIDGTDDYQDSEIVDVAVDENGNILGQWSCFEDEWLYEQEFYKDGKIFYFEAAEDEDEDDDYDWDYLEDGDMSIDDVIDYWSLALDALERADVTDSTNPYVVDSFDYLDDGYRLVLAEKGSDDRTYTYVVDKEYKLTGYGLQLITSQNNYYMVEWAIESTLEDVQTVMDEQFDISLWDIEDDEDLEIVLSILQWAIQTDEYDIPELWDAVHIDDIEYDWDEEDEYWITIQDDALYGRFEQSGIQDTSYSETRYFMNNYYFSIQDEDGEIDYDYDTYYEDYEDIIDAYTYPIADAENFLDEDDDGNLIISEDVYSYELTENSDGGYTLKLTYGDWWGRDSATIYTYTTDENLDVYKIEYEEGSIEEEDYEYNLLEWISEQDIEQKMSDFDISLWID